MRIPPRNIEAITIKEPTDRRAMPEIPLPLVHPSARRAPNKKRKPPQKAIMNLGRNADVFKTLVQRGETGFLMTPERRLERYAPKPIPTTNPNCHQFFNKGKQPASPPFPKIQQATEPNDPDVPNDAPKMRKTGIWSRPITMPATYGDQTRR